MKNLFVLLVILVSGTAFAIPGDITFFECKTSKVIEGKKPTQFSFYVENLNTPKAEVGYWSKEETEEPVKTIPANSILDLNDNFKINLSGKGLELNSDGDGCQYTTVMLYKDKGYQTGFARVEDGGCGAKGVPLYTTVSCTVSKIR